MKLNKFLVFAIVLYPYIASAGDITNTNKENKNIDYSKALQSYMKGAIEGDAVWQNVAALMYRDGKGTSQDYATAIHWFKLSAAQGYEGGQYNLASMYANGKGLAKNYVHAHMWSNLSARNGDAEAVEQRNFFESKMTPQQVALAQKLARECQARNFKNCD